MTATAEYPSASNTLTRFPWVVNSENPLIRMENIVEYVGDDEELQHRVLEMCQDLLVKCLPQFRKAMQFGDVATVCRITHYVRGSLGMLGLPAMMELSEEIEYHLDDLGADCWRQRCQGFYGLLRHLQAELQVRLAA